MEKNINSYEKSGRLQMLLFEIRTTPLATIILSNNDSAAAVCVLGPHQGRIKNKFEF